MDPEISAAPNPSTMPNLSTAPNLIAAPNAIATSGASPTSDVSAHDVVDSRSRSHVFESKYKSDDSDWGNSSGPGSRPYFTIEYQALISRFIELNRVRNVIDIGCGDWGFSRYINFGMANYIGFDVVPSLVEANQKKFSGDRVDFRTMPTELENLPGGDLLLMKDVLQHFPNSDIFDFRARVFGKFKYCLLTNSFEKLDTARNTDIEMGGFRCLDLLAEPFNFEGTYLLEFGSAVWERIRVLLLK